jgi:hypothetical protein
MTNKYSPVLLNSKLAGISTDGGNAAPARGTGGQASLAQKPPLGNYTRLLDLNKKYPSVPIDYQTAAPNNPRAPTDAE